MFTCTVGLLSGFGTWGGISVHDPHIHDPGIQHEPKEIVPQITSKWKFATEPFRLRSKVFRAVIHTAKDLRDDIYLPKIVFDELINKFHEELQRFCDSLRSYTYCIPAFDPCCIA